MDMIVDSQVTKLLTCTTSPWASLAFDITWVNTCDAFKLYQFL